MPFGHGCEYADFDACVAANGDKDDPRAWCGALMAETEEGCKVSAAAAYADRHPSGHYVVRQHDDWCVLSLDGKHTLKRATTKDEAWAWCDTRFKSFAQRHVHLTGAVNGEVSFRTYAGVEHLVVPVVALIGDIAIWPMNAPHPELVPYEVLAVAPAGWNGRPVCDGHPMLEGAAVSANVPDVLEASRMGWVFNAMLAETKRLHMEAWVDPAQARALGAEAERTVERLRALEDVEVSVGCFVVSVARAGRDHRGMSYESAWAEVVPDHLALLREGETGACSIASGCGAPRVAVRHKVTLTGIEWAREDAQVAPVAPEGEDEMPSQQQEPARRTLAQRMRDLARSLTKAGDQRRAVEREDDDQVQRHLRLYGGPAGYAVRLEAGEEMSDVDLRGALHDQLRAVEPGFLWIEEVYPETMQVIYCCDPEGELYTYRRTYATGDAGAVLNDDKERVRRKTTYEAYTTVAEPAAAASGCGCGGGRGRGATAHGKGQHDDGGSNMTRDGRITALIGNPRTPWSSADEAYLKGLTDERLAEIERAARDHDKLAEDLAAAKPAVAQEEQKQEPKQEPALAAAAAKQPTEEEWLRTAPQSVRDLVDGARRRDQQVKDELVSRLKGAQAEYSEAELKSMGTSELERIDKLVSALSPEADYSGRPFPRAAAGRESAPMPNGWMTAAKGKGE